MNDERDQHQTHGGGCCSHASKSPVKWIAIAVFAIGGGYYLWMQHRAHVLQYLPLGFFLLCPLMHLFGGHGGHGGHEHPRGSGRDGNAASEKWKN